MSDEPKTTHSATTADFLARVRFLDTPPAQDLRQLAADYVGRDAGWVYRLSTQADVWHVQLGGTPSYVGEAPPMPPDGRQFEVRHGGPCVAVWAAAKADEFTKAVAAGYARLLVTQCGGVVDVEG